jgi:glycosyltransferase involved in cell wall biosynthesis
MRFVIVTQYYSPEIGATQVRLSAVAAALRNLGHNVEVAAALPHYPKGRIDPAYRGCFYRQEIIDTVKVNRVWVYAAMGTGVKRLASYFSFALLGLWPLSKCRRPDYVWVDSPPLFNAIPGFLAARAWGAKMILNVADPWPDTVRELGLITNPGLLRLAERFEKWAYNRAYRVTAVTRGIQHLLGRKGVPPEKVMFLPNGVDVSLFKPRPADRALLKTLGLEGKKTVLYAGTMSYIHGLDTVLEAATVLRNEQDLVFLLIGGGSEGNRLKQAARDQKLDNVVFLDPAPPEFISRLYSFSMASLALVRNNSLANLTRSAKMFPAMAAGVPLIYSGTGEGAEIVAKAKAGLVIPPENPQALAEGVLLLANNPDMAGQLGANARWYAERHLDWNKLVRSWVDGLSGDFPLLERAGGAVCHPQSHGGRAW